MKGRTFVQPLLVMRFIRRHYGAQKGGAIIWESQSDPRRKQNLSANLNQTAKLKVYKTTEIAVFSASEPAPVL